MSGRSISVYTDTIALHEYLCTLIQNGHEYCELLIKQPQTVMFSNYAKKINVKSLKNCEKVSVNQDRSALVYTDTD